MIFSVMKRGSWGYKSCFYQGLMIQYFKLGLLADMNLRSQSYGENLRTKIRDERKKNKLTQKELAGNFITRNMLSQIENNLAKPSNYNDGVFGESFK